MWYGKATKGNEMTENIYEPKIQASVKASRFTAEDPDKAGDVMGVVMNGPGPVFYYHIPNTAQSGSVVDGEWICRKLHTGDLFVLSDDQFTVAYRHTDQVR